MALRKKLDPRFKRQGDGTLEGKIRTRPVTDEYRKGYDKIDWSKDEKNEKETQGRVEG